MIFKSGDKVTLKRKTEWAHSIVSDHKPVVAPRFGEIVTVECYPYPTQCDYCAFYEYQTTTKNGRYAFYEHDFEKVVSDSVLAAELESVPEPYSI